MGAVYLIAVSEEVGSETYVLFIPTVIELMLEPQNQLMVTYSIRLNIKPDQVLQSSIKTSINYVGKDASCIWHGISLKLHSQTMEDRI